jgi:hypothetical protein
MTPISRRDALTVAADVLERSDWLTVDLLADQGDESASENAERVVEILREMAAEPEGYVIAERPIFGDDAGRLVIDWDGVVHADRIDAEYELATANSPDEDDPTQTPSDHWKLYELREVQP